MKILSTVLFCAILSWSLPALACKCVGLAPKEAYEKSDLVVIGNQLSARLPSQIPLDEKDETPVTFSIQHVIKGVYQNKEISVKRALNENVLCQGFLIKNENPQLIFLVRKEEGFAFMSDCYSASFKFEPKNNTVDFYSEKVHLDKLDAFFKSK